MPTPRALVFRPAGTNCDRELVFALEQAGATVDVVHLKQILAEPARLDRYALITLPGGFSYGDDIAAGQIARIAGVIGERIIHVSNSSVVLTSYVCLGRTGPAGRDASFVPGPGSVSNRSCGPKMTYDRYRIVAAFRCSEHRR